MGKHLVFYDGTCGLCDQIVQFILCRDQDEVFDFAPLQGSTAKQLLKDLPAEMKSADSLVLIENYLAGPEKAKPSIFGKGALRICWLLGGGWKVLGVISWLPSIFYDWGYRLVAKNRHRFFFSDSCVLPTPETRHRFLP